MEKEKEDSFISKLLTIVGLWVLISIICYFVIDIYKGFTKAIKEKDKFNIVVFIISFIAAALFIIHVN